MFFDAALTFDPETRQCDLALSDDFDLAIDETPITPMLLSIGLDRRAAPDDELPQGRSRFLQPHGLSERRGGPTDALDANGQRAGSRIWLLSRAKRTEITRGMFQFWLQECLAWAKSLTGHDAEINVEWRGNILTYSAMIDEAEIKLSQEIG